MNAEPGMCDRCKEIDEAIAHYGWIKGQLFDPKTRQAADDLITELEAEKRTLHPGIRGTDG